MMSDLKNKFKEVNTEIKYQTSGLMIRLAKAYGDEHGLTTEHVLNNMTRYLDMPLSMQIEYNLTRWKGYEGIELIRDDLYDSSIDLKNTLLAMDTLDGKIDRGTAVMYDAKLTNIKRLYSKLNDAVISETIFFGSTAYKN